MKIDRVEVTSGVTVSYKKYRFVRLEYTIGGTLGEKDDASAMIDTLRTTLRAKLAKDAKKEVQAWRKLGANVEGSEPSIDFD